MLRSSWAAFMMFLAAVMMAFFPFSYFFMPHKSSSELLTLVIIWPALGELGSAKDESETDQTTTGGKVFFELFY